jgi:acyl-CoA thioesterase
LFSSWAKVEPIYSWEKGTTSKTRRFNTSECRNEQRTAFRMKKKIPLPPEIRSVYIVLAFSLPLQLLLLRPIEVTGLRKGLQERGGKPKGVKT